MFRGELKINTPDIRRKWTIRGSIFYQTYWLTFLFRNANWFRMPAVFPINYVLGTCKPKVCTTFIFPVFATIILRDQTTVRCAIFISHLVSQMIHIVCGRISVQCTISQLCTCIIGNAYSIRVCRAISNASNTRTVGEFSAC